MDNLHPGPLTGIVSTNSCGPTNIVGVATLRQSINQAEPPSYTFDILCPREKQQPHVDQGIKEKRVNPTN